MHTVDIEEERDHVDEHGAVADDLAHGMRDLGEHAADDMAERILGTALAPVLLPIRADQRQRECEPPRAGDEKRQTRGDHGGHADSRAAHDECQADDERHRGTDVAPGVAGARNGIHALVGGDIGQHGIVERHRRVKADGAEHIDREECHSRHRNGLGTAQDETGQEKAQEELDLVARVIGERTQDGHQQCDDKRGDGLGIAPRHHQVGRRRPGVDGVEINGHHRRVQQHERRVAHVVHDPVALELGEFHSVPPVGFPSMVIDRDQPQRKDSVKGEPHPHRP